MQLEFNEAVANLRDNPALAHVSIAERMAEARDALVAAGLDPVADPLLVYQALEAAGHPAPYDPVAEIVVAAKTFAPEDCRRKVCAYEPTAVGKCLRCGAQREPPPSREPKARPTARPQMLPKLRTRRGQTRLQVPSLEERLRVAASDIEPLATRYIMLTNVPSRQAAETFAVKPATIRSWNLKTRNSRLSKAQRTIVKKNLEAIRIVLDKILDDIEYGTAK